MAVQFQVAITKTTTTTMSSKGSAWDLVHYERSISAFLSNQSNNMEADISFFGWYI